MPGDGTKGALARAAHNILRPLVRLLIAHSVTFPAFSRLAKEVYIEVATAHFTLAFKRQTDSRVALVTGITRKEIGRIRRGKSPRPDEQGRVDHALATRVIGRWLSEPRYRSAQGSPLTLPYEAPAERPSFVGLVNQLGGDIPPRAVLDELLRVGAAALTTEGDVRAVERGYVPSRGTEEKLDILGRDAAELIGAIAYNTERAGDEAFLQRKVYYTNIGAQALPELRRKIRRTGAEFAENVNEILAGYDRDRNPAAPGGTPTRVAVTVYYYEE